MGVHSFFSFDIVGNAAISIGSETRPITQVNLRYNHTTSGRDSLGIRVTGSVDEPIYDSQGQPSNGSGMRVVAVDILIVQ